MKYTCHYCGEPVTPPSCINNCEHEGCEEYCGGCMGSKPYNCREGACGQHKIPKEMFPRVVIESINFKSGKGAIGVYLDGKFVSSGASRDFEWVTWLLFNLCKSLEIPAAIDAKTVTPEEWDKIVG